MYLLYLLTAGLATSRGYFGFPDAMRNPEMSYLDSPWATYGGWPLNYGSVTIWPQHMEHSHVKAEDGGKYYKFFWRKKIDHVTKPMVQWVNDIVPPWAKF